MDGGQTRKSATGGTDVTARPVERANRKTRFASKSILRPFDSASPSRAPAGPPTVPRALDIIPEDFAVEDFTERRSGEAGPVFRDAESEESELEQVRAREMNGQPNYVSLNRVKRTCVMPGQSDLGPGKGVSSRNGKYWNTKREGVTRAESERLKNYGVSAAEQIAVKKIGDLERSLRWEKRREKEREAATPTVRCKIVGKDHPKSLPARNQDRRTTQRSVERGIRVDSRLSDIPPLPFEYSGERNDLERKLDFSNFAQRS
ncbi:hypothetical protein KM043_008993 [Ampulex compressa]|nr:hypothetical protein KM043_008993 [Ampulex compressa]